MKKILIITLLILGSNSFAQKLVKSNQARPLNSIGVNILGDASEISANYERFFLIKDNFILSSKISFGFNEKLYDCHFLVKPCAKKTLFTVSNHLTGNIGKGISFFEFGLGETFLIGNNTTSYMIYPMIGFRILPLKSNKLNFRIFGQFPLMKTKPSGILFIPIGFYFGVSF